MKIIQPLPLLRKQYKMRSYSNHRIYNWVGDNYLDCKLHLAVVSELRLEQNINCAIHIKRRLLMK